MIEASISGLLMVLHLKPFLFMLLGSAIGFWVGILPGIGGGTTLALLLPFVYNMTPQEAFPFLLGVNTACATTGDITSVLFGIPGESSSVAIIVDGYAMTKKGEAGRALGAALMSSLIGGLVGAIALAAAIPIVRPLVLAFASPEKFMMMILGLTCISSLSGTGKRSLLTGMLSGGLGFLCSLVGQDQRAGIHRFTFGLVYLWEGLPLISVAVGLYAIAEIVDLAVRGTAIAGDAPSGRLGRGAWEGTKDTFRHFWLTIRCSLIGTWIGILPGIGGGVSQWLAYAHATQSAKSPEEREGFGRGDVRGVLGPGAANNTTIGAALIPTLAFGIPGNFGTAILLGAFFILGLVPGPDMLTKYLPLTYSMVWTIIITTIIVVSVSYLLINNLAKLTTIRGGLIVPFLLLLSFIGAYTSNNQISDLIILLLFGGLGCLMMRLHWPRPPFIMGFILGKLTESYLYPSTIRYGAAWLLRPGVIILLCLAIAVAIYPLIQAKRLKRREGGVSIETIGPQGLSKSRWRMKYNGDSLISFGFMVIAAWVVITALKWPLSAALFPMIISIPVFFMAMYMLMLSLFGREEVVEKQSKLDFKPSEKRDQMFAIRRRTLLAFTWIIGFLLLILFFGFPIAVPFFVFLYLKLCGRERWGISLGLTASALIFFYGLFVWFLNIRFEDGWIQEGLRAFGII